jgi:hypothetical protein
LSVSLETAGCVIALLPEEPAGRISTRNAGTISFQATLTWHPGEGVPVGPTLDKPAPGARLYSLVQTDHLESATRKISCEIRALYPEKLTNALGVVLRSVTAHAALSEAVLETRTVRLADPSEARPALAETLACQLSDFGLHVSSGPSWVPTPGADISVGTRGSGEVLERFLRSHTDWWRTWLDRRPPSG